MAHLVAHSTLTRYVVGSSPKQTEYFGFPGSPQCSMTGLYQSRVRTEPGKPGKAWNFVLFFSRPGKAWNSDKWPGKAWKIRIPPAMQFLHGEASLRLSRTTKMPLF